MNTTVIVGRLTKEIRTNTVQGSPVVNFAAAFEFGSVPKMINIEGRDTLVYIRTTTFIDYERGTLAGGGDPRADSLALGY